MFVYPETLNGFKVWLKDLEARAEAQAPYFDARLLDKINQVKTIINNWENES